MISPYRLHPALLLALAPACIDPSVSVREDPYADRPPIDEVFLDGDGAGGSGTAGTGGASTGGTAMGGSGSGSGGSTGSDSGSTGSGSSGSGSGSGGEGGSGIGGSGSSGAGGSPTDAHLLSLSPLAQSTVAGALVDVPPAFELRDAQGSPIVGSLLEVEVTGGGAFEGPGQSSTTSATFLTDGLGQVRLDGWTLGKLAGDYHLTARALQEPNVPPLTYDATAASDFEVRVEFVNPVSADQEAVFDEAARRWRGAIVDALAPITVSLGSIGAACGVSWPNDQTITTEGVVIFAEIGPIDGPGQVLGSAGPCLIRSSDGSPLSGVMRFDSADLANLEQAGTLEAVILHEMGHVLGIGTLWPLEGLLANPSVPDAAGADTHHTGPRARAAFDAMGGATFAGSKVPVENSGIPGSGDGHWRESVAGHELMTPYLSGTSQPLSALTIASLADFPYYGTNALAADPFTLPGQGLALQPPPSAHVACSVMHPHTGPVPPGTLPVP